MTGCCAHSQSLKSSAHMKNLVMLHVTVQYSIRSAFGSGPTRIAFEWVSNIGTPLGGTIETNGTLTENLFWESANSCYRKTYEGGGEGELCFRPGRKSSRYTGRIQGKHASRQALRSLARRDSDDRVTDAVPAAGSKRAAPQPGSSSASKRFHIRIFIPQVEKSVAVANLPRSVDGP